MGGRQDSAQFLGKREIALYFDLPLHEGSDEVLLPGGEPGEIIGIAMDDAIGVRPALFHGQLPVVDGNPPSSHVFHVEEITSADAAEPFGEGVRFQFADDLQDLGLRVFRGNGCLRGGLFGHGVHPFIRR